MATEYEFSARLVFWGDALDFTRLEADLQLTGLEGRKKGDRLRGPGGGASKGVAKTGTLCWEISPTGSISRRDPGTQLLAAYAALERLNGSLETYGVADAELQMDIYYRDNVSGEPDFMFPSELFAQLVRHRVALRLTVLP